MKLIHFAAVLALILLVMMRIVKKKMTQVALPMLKNSKFLRFYF